MGLSTDFVGHIEIEPPLNDVEMSYLSAFAASRRYDRGDPYDVPGNPRAEDGSGVDTETYNRTPPGQPNLWCDWQVCWDGCCITWSGKEKSYSMEPWLRYVIDHFLRPGALASGDPRFAGFGFDHSLTGMVVGCRRDNKELFAIRVVDNHVTREIIMPADPRYRDFPPLPYEQQVDLQAARATRRRRPLPGEDQKVIPLERRNV